MADSIEPQVTLTMPLLSFTTKSKSGVYGLIITDATGRTHYWEKDGSYDGWSEMEQNKESN